MNEILTQEKSIYLQIAEMIETDILRDILLEEERVPVSYTHLTLPTT